VSDVANKIEAIKCSCWKSSAMDNQKSRLMMGIYRGTDGDVGDITPTTPKAAAWRFYTIDARAYTYGKSLLVPDTYRCLAGSLSKLQTVSFVEMAAYQG
jgi:hypothetical protein